MSERGFRNRVGEILGEDDTQAQRSGAMERWLAPTTESRVEQVPVDAVDDALWRPAGDDDPTAYRALKASVRASGILQPLVLRRVSADRLQVVSGARRLRAARETAQSTVPALIRELSDLEAFMGGWDAVLRAGVTATERDRLAGDLAGAGMAAADVSALVATVPTRESEDETAGADADVDAMPEATAADAEPVAAELEPTAVAAEAVDPEAPTAAAAAPLAEAEDPEAAPEAAVADVETAPAKGEPEGEPRSIVAEVGPEAAEPAGDVDAPLTAAAAVVTGAAPDAEVVVGTPADDGGAVPGPHDGAEAPVTIAETAAASADPTGEGPAATAEMSDDTGDQPAADAEEATETLVGTLPVVMPEEDVTPVLEVEWQEAVVAAVVDEERLEPEGLVESAVELEEAGRSEPEAVSEPEPEPAALVETAPAPEAAVGAEPEPAPEPEPVPEPVVELEPTTPPSPTTGRRTSAVAPTVIPIDLPAEAPAATGEEVGAPVTAPLGAGAEAWSPRVAAASSLPNEPVTADAVGTSGGTSGAARLLADPRTYATAGVFLVVWAVVFISVSVLLGAGGGRPLVAAAVVAVVGILATMGGLAMPRRGL